jgi:hypothetical protein
MLGLFLRGHDNLHSEVSVAHRASAIIRIRSIGEEREEKFTVVNHLKYLLSSLPATCSDQHWR